MEAMTPTTAMLAFDRLEQQLKIAKARGFKIRKEWLGGATGGFCRFNQQDWIFVDLSLSVAEQLEQVTQAIALATVGERSSADR